MNPNNQPTYITPPPTFQNPAESPKPKSKLPIIIAAVVIVIIAVVVIILVAIPKSTKNEPADETSTQTPDSSKSESTEITKIHERVNISSSPSDFSGYVYDINGTNYTLDQMKAKLDREDGNYFFPADPTVSTPFISENQWTSGASIYNEMLKQFGNPNTIIESYRQLNEDEGEGYYGVATLIWRCGSLYVSMVIEDFTNQPDRHFSYPNSGMTVTMFQIKSDASQWNSLLDDDSYEIYGKENL